MEKRQTRGIRNNNPLNIKIANRNNWKGRVPVEQNTDGVFEQYVEPVYGIRAALKLLLKYIRDGYNTVPKIITRWCPPLSPADNSTRIYTDYVLKALMENVDGFDRTTAIGLCDRKVLFVLMSAMCMMESRYRLSSDMFDQAWNMA